MNFILGRGERLVSAIKAKGSWGRKGTPYTFEEARDRLIPQFEAAYSSIEMLPEAACPGDLTTEVLTLHPEFIAPSYFPENPLYSLSHYKGEGKGFLFHLE